MSGSRKARATAARLFSVQAAYQAMQTGKRPAELIEEYLQHNVGMDLDEGEMVTPDQNLFKSILSGITIRADEIDALLAERLNGTPDNLMKAILSCGCYELMAHSDIDGPIVIADYMHVANGFFAGAEPKLVNGVLDALLRQLRGDARHIG
jgi:transcription antitermination protein NusB